MDEPLATKDGEPIAAWLLKANPDVFDIEAEIEAFGIVTNWSLSARPTYRIPLMAEGQKCFLFQTAGAGGKGFSGIIAVGEVIGEPVAQASENPELWEDEDRASQPAPYVPLELLPLEVPISREELVGHRVLREMEVLRAPQMSNPIVVRPDELAALEDFGLAVVEPSDEQLQRLAEDAAEDDSAWFALSDGSKLYGVDESEEVGESWVVVAIDNMAGTREVLGDGLGWRQAFGALREIASVAGGRALIQRPDEAGDVEAVAVFNVGDGERISVVRSGQSTFVAFGYEDDEAEEMTALREWDDLGTAVMELSEQLGEPELGEWDDEEDVGEE